MEMQKCKQNVNSHTVSCLCGDHKYALSTEYCHTVVCMASLVPIPIPTFSMLHAEKGEGLVDLVMSG